MEFPWPRQDPLGEVFAYKPNYGHVADKGLDSILLSAR